MKASEAIKLLEKVDPDQEVTVIIGTIPIKTNDYTPAPYQPQFVPSYVRRPDDVWLSKKPQGFIQ